LEEFVGYLTEKAEVNTKIIKATRGGSPFKKQIMIFGGIVTIVGGILLAFVGPGIKLLDPT
jgi:hypothetical protein